MVKLERFLNNVIGGIILTFMMLLVTGDVSGRYLLNRPIHGTTEITEFMMVALFYFTLAYTQADKGHIRIELLTSHLSPRNQLICEMITYPLAIILFVLITWQGTLATIKSWDFGETTFGLIELPLYPAKALIPVGSFLFSLRLLLDFVCILKKIQKGATND